MKAVFKATMKWMMPTHLFRLRPIYGLASLLFHLGILLVPLFYAGHVNLWRATLPLAWPTLAPVVADALSLAAIVGLALILAGRLLVSASRDLTTGEDVWILLVLLVLVVSRVLGGASDLFTLSAPRPVAGPPSGRRPGVDPDALDQDRALHPLPLDPAHERGRLALSGDQRPSRGRGPGQGAGAHMNSYAILTDVTKCIGCEDCVAACKLTHQTGDEDAPWAWQDKATDLSSTRWTTIQRTEEGRYVRIHCRHCLDPGCAAACPVGALKVTAEGAVDYDPTICMGCRYCMTACPFRMTRYEWESPTPRIRKCILCYDKVHSGEFEQPACTRSCPTGATIFGEREAMLAEARRRIKNGRWQVHRPHLGRTRGGGDLGDLHIGRRPGQRRLAGQPQGRAGARAGGEGAEHGARRPS